MLLYCIYNSINGKRYIGLTTMGLKKRWYFHIDRAINEKSDTALSCAIRKYGSDSFVIEEICSLAPHRSLDDLRILEMDMIAQENTMVPYGYNMTKGGDATLGYKYSDEQLSKRIGKKTTAETRAKMSASHKGFRHTPETRKRLSEIAMTKNMNRGKSGYKHTEATKKKFRDAWTPERKAKAKERMKEIQKYRWIGKVISLKESA